VIQERSNVLLAPNAALRFKPSDAERDGKRFGNTKRERSTKPAGARVYVIRGEGITPVPVQIGITDGRYSEVVSGDLKAGDRTVLEDNQPELGTRGPQPFRMRPF